MTTTSVRQSWLNSIHSCFPTCHEFPLWHLMGQPKIIISFKVNPFHLHQPMLNHFELETVEGGYGGWHMLLEGRAQSDSYKCNYRAFIAEEKKKRKKKKQAFFFWAPPNMLSPQTRESYKQAALTPTWALAVICLECIYLILKKRRNWEEAHQWCCSGQCSGGGRRPLCYMALVLFCLLGGGSVTWPTFHLLCLFHCLLVLPEDDRSHNPSQTRGSRLSGSSLR